MTYLQQSANRLSLSDTAAVGQYRDKSSACRQENAHLLIDDGNHGANWNHRRAIEWAAEQPCRVVVLEDDALPVEGFTEKVRDWLARFPDDMLSLFRC